VRDPQLGGSIANGRGEIADILEQSPNLRRTLPGLMLKNYARAMSQAGRDTRLSPEALPSEPPFSLEEVLGEDERIEAWRHTSLPRDLPWRWSPGSASPTASWPATTARCCGPRSQPGDRDDPGAVERSFAILKRWYGYRRSATGAAARSRWPREAKTASTTAASGGRDRRGRSHTPSHPLQPPPTRS
jgi:hypothetical protein